MVSLVGPLAMIGCKPRQARKGATVTADSCAGVWLAGGTSINIYADKRPAKKYQLKTNNSRIL